MTRRQRMDFIIIAWIFGVLVGSTNTFSMLTSQIMVSNHDAHPLCFAHGYLIVKQPVGYSDDVSGFMGVGYLFYAYDLYFDPCFTRHVYYLQD